MYTSHRQSGESQSVSQPKARLKRHHNIDEVVEEEEEEVEDEVVVEKEKEVEAEEKVGGGEGWRWRWLAVEEVGGRGLVRV